MDSEDNCGRAVSPMYVQWYGWNFGGYYRATTDGWCTYSSMCSSARTTGRDVCNDVRQRHGSTTNHPFEERVRICAIYGDRQCRENIWLELIGIQVRIRGVVTF